MFALLLVLGLQAAAAAGVVFDRPAVVCEIDLSVMKGTVRRLSWSPQGQSLHIQTISDPDLYDYIVDLHTGEISLAFGEPAWSVEYWARKSALDAPGRASLKLEVLENNRRTRPIPFSGGFANGGAQTPDPRNPVDLFENEVRLFYSGVEIGNWINGAPMAGDTFGWGPDRTGLLAFTDKNGHLTVIDPSRRAVAVAGVKDAVFPAWSPDGSRIAFLQKNGKKKLKLLTVAVH